MEQSNLYQIIEKNEYSVIIETDSYAGNFEREMCAFITGEIGECEVGSDNIDKEFDYSMFDELINQKPDTYGVSRPVDVYSENSDSLEIYFADKPSKEMINLIHYRAELFDPNIRIKEVYALKKEIKAEVTKIKYN